ncbi:ion transporter [Pseudomarimonas arenosa]|uniref:Ion transporter n=1 Tax=Pseudomarimonas arenosa TaxID=2774145 RepID=A0AAW3ZGC7_9GAMM|nr:ion transporter [Pseudomarimonas arenosa]MBD8525103.1 ion transporter [Pseudomarimonas arenosa]
MSRHWPPPPAEAQNNWREKTYRVIFGHDTPAGRGFDLLLMLVILLSILVAVLDSVQDLHQRFGTLLYALEWGFTVVFTIEYVLRLLIVRRPIRYALSFYGIIDLLAVLPTYLSLLLPGTQSLLVIRVLRLLRIFRILKLAEYLREAGVLIAALRRSWRKIFVFLCVILSLVTVFGALMYVVEGPEHGFTSIPTAMYWAVVTVSTVGFGDIAPQTTLGRMITSVLILIGYGIIAVPTGIYTAELTQGLRQLDARTCEQCQQLGHSADAKHCRRCGAALPTE